MRSINPLCSNLGTDVLLMKLFLYIFLGFLILGFIAVIIIADLALSAGENDEGAYG